MRRRRLALATVMAAAMPATAFAQGFGGAPLPPPQTATPEGPATLVSDWTGSNTLEGFAPRVLMGVRVTVGRGGRAGRVRFRAQEKPRSPVHEGAQVTLPAEPGAYTFPIPVRACRGTIATACSGSRRKPAGTRSSARGTAAARGNTNCKDQTLTIHRTPRVPRTLGGRYLTIEGVTERDLDEDLAGDLTEDVTRLRTSVRIQRGGGSVAITTTVHNVGARTADRPVVDLQLSRPGFGVWTAPCADEPRWAYGRRCQRCSGACWGRSAPARRARRGSSCRIPARSS